MIELANPSLLFVGLIFLPILLKRKAAFIGYSHLQLIGEEGVSRFLPGLPKVLHALVIVLLILGLARPQWRSLVKHERFLARDIIMVMDLSYSMEGFLELKDRQKKIAVAKNAARQFIEKRENDRIGLLVFGDETFGSWPLTRDLALILKKLDRLGSTFYGGTNLVKPFVKAIAHFREMGQSTSRVLVFLSDGEAKIPKEMKERIVTEIKKMGVHLYVVGINLRKEESDLAEIVDRTEGLYIVVESTDGLNDAFGAVDRLEQSRIEVDVRGESRELYPIFVLLALGGLFAWMLLRNTLFIELC